MKETSTSSYTPADEEEFRVRGFYERLAARKRPDESFSDLLDRLTDHETAFELPFGVA